MTKGVTALTLPPPVRPFTDGEMWLFLGCGQTEAVGGQCQGCWVSRDCKGS